MTDDTGMTSRRAYLLGGLAGIVGTAGCLDFIRDEPAEFEAGYSRVDDGTLSETGYAFEEQREEVVEREYEAAGQSRDVIARNKVTNYTREIEFGEVGEIEGALFASLTSPQVRVLEQEFNPIDEMESIEIARLIQGQYGEIENLQAEEETEATVSGETTTQTTFRADATVEGHSVEIFVHVSEPVEMGEDFVVAVGGYPTMFPEQEEDILTMMEGVEPDE